MKELTDKQKTEELTREVEKAKKEIDSLHNQLFVVNKKLEESESMKSHFISNVTNEIMNPFASIIALSENILSVKKENWKKVISMVSLIYSEAYNLDFQLRNIFVAAKIEAGEIYPQISNVEIKQIVNSVSQSFKYIIKKKKLKIEISFDDAYSGEDNMFYFKTDPEKLKLILSNLMSNAVNFSHDEGKIIIHSKKEDDKLVILVRDYGTGISEQNQKIIFDRFKRLDSGINSINRGHGLGLSINKALLDTLDGDIKINSQPDKGATFTISIPESDMDISDVSFDGNNVFFDDEDDELF